MNRKALMQLVVAVAAILVSLVYGVLIAALLGWAGPARGQPVPLLPLTIELRYCYTQEAVPRTADGAIRRSSWVRELFRRAHPCPATGLRDGACPGWAVDHVIPLVCGGCDSVNNMQWLPATIKSGPDIDDKDRWEQRVYCK